MNHESWARKFTNGTVEGVISKVVTQDTVDTMLDDWDNQVTTLQEEIDGLNAQVERLEMCLRGNFDDCRRCGNKRYVDEAGYCSPDCRDGLTGLAFQKASGVTA